MLARGPLPDEIRDRIYQLNESGWTPSRIAKRMNERDVMPGRGGKDWTSRKINKILDERQFVVEEPA